MLNNNKPISKYLNQTSEYRLSPKDVFYCYIWSKCTPVADMSIFHYVGLGCMNQFKV